MCVCACVLIPISLSGSLASGQHSPRNINLGLLIRSTLVIVYRVSPFGTLFHSRSCWTLHVSVPLWDPSFLLVLPAREWTGNVIMLGINFFRIWIYPTRFRWPRIISDMMAVEKRRRRGAFGCLMTTCGTDENFGKLSLSHGARKILDRDKNQREMRNSKSTENQLIRENWSPHKSGSGVEISRNHPSSLVPLLANHWGSNQGLFPKLHSSDSFDPGFVLPS